PGRLCGGQAASPRNTKITTKWPLRGRNKIKEKDYPESCADILSANRDETCPTYAGSNQDFKVIREFE
ncbi:MAG: hypothetical protein P8Y60_15840, partial [Calditrichota bacterium]